MLLLWHHMKMKTKDSTSWHAATLIKEWAQYIVPLQFYILW
jgi:hypothetical protein